MQYKSRRSSKLKIKNDSSLRKIQPKGKRKIYSKSPFNNLLFKVGTVFVLLLVFYLLFIFEMPANYPNRFNITSMKVDAEEISINVDTNSYKGKLLPLDFILALGNGEITIIGEEEKTILFNDGTKIVIREGSRKMSIDGKKVKLNAPVMTYKGIILVPGELLERLYPDISSFNDGKAVFELSKQKVEGEYQKFTGSEGYQRLVNKENPLEPDYAPTDLVEMNSYNTITAYGSNTKLRKEAADALAKMYSENSVKYIMSSGYRDFDTQTQLFEEEVAQNKASGMSEDTAREQAATIVAIPGTSEHQSGLAIDFSIPGVLLTQSFKNTEAGQWLAGNSYKYGFVLRYTEAQTAITKIIFEPWHFRYIGYPHSEILYKDGIVFDTYIEMLREEKMRNYKAEDGNNYVIWLLSGKLKPEKLEYLPINGIGVSTDNKDGIILTLPNNN